MIKRFTCRFTHDPDTCLFYTFLDLKNNFDDISTTLREPLSYMGNNDFTDEEKEVFPLPILLNEMLRMKGHIDGRGEVHFVFWDDSELYQFLRRHKGRIDIRRLQVDKIPLFENGVEKKIELVDHLLGLQWRPIHVEDHHPLDD